MTEAEGEVGFPQNGFKRPSILILTIPRRYFCCGSLLLLTVNDHLFEKELFIRFTASAFRKLLSIYVFSYFPFGFEGRMWDLIVSVRDHCLSFYFETFVTTWSLQLAVFVTLLFI